MRVKMVAGMLVGSVVVAVACSAQHALDNPSDKDGGVLDALLDAVSSETRDALAADKPTVDVLKCDKTTGGAIPVSYAERAFPGRTKEDLVRGSAMVCDAPDHCVQIPMGIADGLVTVQCAKTSTATIVMPPAL